MKNLLQEENCLMDEVKDRWLMTKEVEPSVFETVISDCMYNWILLASYKNGIDAHKGHRLILNKLEKVGSIDLEIPMMHISNALIRIIEELQEE